MKLQRAFIIFGLFVAGITMSLGLYFGGVSICFVFVYFNNQAIRGIATLYAESPLFWIMLNQAFNMIIYYYYLKWAGSGKTSISNNLKLGLIGIVYILGVILIRSALHRF